MTGRQLVRIALASCVIFGSIDAASAQEGSISAAMSVSLEVQPNCTVAVEPLAFGPVSVETTGSPSATASIDVACGPGVAFAVSLDGGLHSSDGTRRVLDPASGAYVAYDIFVDPAHSRRWGFSGESVPATTTAAGTAHLTAYGRVESGAEVAAGNYADVVTVTTVF